jgi:hypothetical protein
MLKMIVVQDPLGEVLPGEVVTGEATAAKLIRRRVVMLPVDDDVGDSAVAGYFHRAWGAGWLFDSMAGTRGCPMLLQLKPDRLHVYWAARVVPDVGVQIEDVQGQLRLVADTSGGGLGGLSQTKMAPRLEQLGALDPDGGWTIGGRCTIGVSQAGLIALSIYGVAKCARVQWAAVSQCTFEVDVFPRM